MWFLWTLQYSFDYTSIYSISDSKTAEYYNHTRMDIEVGYT